MGYRVISSDQTTKEIIDNAAGILLKEKGADFSIRELCSAAGISLGTFYIYYKSKSDLILARKHFSDASMQSAAESSKGEPAADRLKKLLLSYSEYVCRRGLASVSEVYSCMLTARGNRENDLSRPLYQCFETVIREGQEEGCFSRALSAREYADLLAMFCRGLTFEFCHYQDDAQDLMERSRKAIDTFLAGICL